MKKVLIAHQSTIPYYRVPFYRAIERLRPPWWEFDVVYDPHEAQRAFFVENERDSWDFSIRNSRNHTLSIGGKRLSFQLFPFVCRHYDAIVVGSELNNLSYPLTALWRLGGKSIIFWGHGRDYTAAQPHGLKRISERAKIWLSRFSDGFFAYTPGVCNYMIANGLDKNKIYVLYNTIDIVQQRAEYERLISDRKKIRKCNGLEDKKVLLFIGRLTKQKKLEYLFHTFRYLQEKDPSYHMLIVGGGDHSLVTQLREQVGEKAFTYYGAIYDSRLSSLYTMSDLYIFPGAVGLGPLQSLCFDLTPVVINLPIHKPEYEYLNSNNAVILPNGVTYEEYAETIHKILLDRSKWLSLRSQAWPSIKHLTIENMASNFIHGINSVLSNEK